MNQREIKFRYVWQNEDTGSISMPIFSLYRIAANGLSGVDRHVVIGVNQYLEITDRNGQEIYEGDIVRVLYTDWPSKLESDPRTLQEYLNDLAKVKVVEWRDTFDVGPHGFVEVIGNIYENKDLIK